MCVAFLGAVSDAWTKLIMHSLKMQKLHAVLAGHDHQSILVKEMTEQK